MNSREFQKRIAGEFRKGLRLKPWGESRKNPEKGFEKTEKDSKTISGTISGVSRDGYRKNLGMDLGSMGMDPGKDVRRIC